MYIEQMEHDPWPAGFYGDTDNAAAYPANDPANASVSYLMRRVRTSIAQAADKRLELQGITRAQMGPLYMLRSARASTVAEIATELQIDPGSMTRMLDRLEAKGLCRRLRSTDDSRVVRIELTPEGRVAADRLIAELADVMNAHLAGFSRDEWNQLKSFLQRVLRNADASFADGMQ